MNEIAVIYQSRYGSTQKYAEWIAEELNAKVFEVAHLTAMQLEKYDTLIFGGGIYASSIAGVSFIKKNFNHFQDKNIIVFTVGIASPARKEVMQPIIEKNFSSEMQKVMSFFHFRGTIDYQKLNLVHKAMMAMMKRMILKKEAARLTADDKEILETYGDKLDYTCKSAIAPLLNYVENYRK